MQAWLDTLSDDVLDTVSTSPRDTITPSRDSHGARALALLRELASASATTSLQVRAGEVIGEGGMGVVRTAQQVALGRTVAVKTLRAERRRDPESAVDLLREAWVSGTVEHPNVVPIHYVGVEPDGTPLIVMKRIEGVEWSKLLADPDAVRRRFGAADLVAWNLGILMQVLNALRFAHHRGIVHRDLKPANVMIGDFGEVYLLDWGIAVALRDDGTGRLPLAAQATEMAGTPCYMAPEMLGRSGGGAITERTDVYLAGSVLFELVAGRPPHLGGSAIETLTKVIESAPDIPPQVPGELARIIVRAMSREPAARYASVDALRQELQQYLEHRGSAELAARATERTDQLLVAIGRGDIERDEIYRLFGACRFGFHEALSVWRGNTEAQAGLARATIALAEYDLRAGHARAAVTLLADLDGPPAELVARAKQAAGDRARRDAAAEQLLAENDPTPGRRTRVALVGFLGVVFTATPLVLALLPGVFTYTYRTHALFSAIAAIVVAAIVWWARDSLTATMVNRRVAAAAIFMLAGEAVLALGLGEVGASVVMVQLATQFVWATAAAWLALTLDPWFAPSSLLYLVAFVIAARWPASQLFVTAAGNLAFAINLIVRWRPDTWTITRGR
ncbi:MAG TPA: serine/threonine-protein kinase [Kofleriaceae bacterium]|nr:serine/threonine-protein kinase [Kofleriaceae bacterium]